MQLHVTPPHLLFSSFFVEKLTHPHHGQCHCITNKLQV
jgi:hypothetical protein